MYAMLESISPRTRKLELFARMHNTHAGWLSLGNQLNGMHLVDEGLRARFRNAYLDVESSPPRSSAMEVESNATQSRIPKALSSLSASILALVRLSLKLYLRSRSRNQPKLVIHLLNLHHDHGSSTYLHHSTFY